MTTHLVWFRADLRANDNLALAAACRDRHATVLALFVATPRQWEKQGMAPRQAAYLSSHLNGLQQTLAEKGIPLIFKEVDDFAASVGVVKAVCEAHNVSHLFYNYQYELNERRRDAVVEKALPDVACQGFDDSVLLAPGSVMTGAHQMYKVFTPFKNAFLRRLREDLPECLAAPKVRDSGALSETLKTLNFACPQQDFDPTLFPADEKAAVARLREFCQHSAADYETQRDFPAIDGTSRLSAALAIGALSPRQCLHRLLTVLPDALGEGPGAVWLNELIWREFYRHLMTYHPELCRYQPFIAWTGRIAWSDNAAHLRAWQTGSTGYPIVDAAMRQLNHTGWMHNRLRMIAASFLVKDLLIDWRAGERYFISQLIDGDLAANNGGWQWAASTGNDSVPYFRIFNPTTQGERFDKEGGFIRTWIPELHGVPVKSLHDPWGWADKQGVSLDYPRPVVEHKQARVATLAAYEAARKS